MRIWLYLLNFSCINSKHFCLNEIYRYAKDKNVVPVVETHGGVEAFSDGVKHFASVTVDKNALIKLMSGVPDIKFNFDPANFFMRQG
ncbi:MAG: sugar phosphate isomerase/epimerase [Clostridiales bacterium]|nr:MAG: sugar phosphate isomerase/epimerase [Clostridiales bacterium]